MYLRRLLLLKLSFTFVCWLKYTHIHTVTHNGQAALDQNYWLKIILTHFHAFNACWAKCIHCLKKLSVQINDAHIVGSSIFFPLNSSIHSFRLGSWHCFESFFGAQVVAAFSLPIESKHSSLESVLFVI